MQRLQYIVSAVCALGLMTAHASTSEPWEIVPEDSLRELRGGIDLGNLVGSFAIQRVVQIDGVIVARMQIVISNLDRLGSGGMPTVSVTGPLAQLVQFMNTGGSAGTAAANGSLAQPGSAGASNAPAAANGAPAAAASSTAGIVPTIALRGANPASAGAAAATPAAPVTPAAQSVSAALAGTSKTVPVGTTGQVIVLSGLPNAGAITTAVQNSVHAASIQTQTTISAAINSMPMLNAVNLANSIRQQMGGP